MATNDLGRALWALVDAADARNDLVAEPEPGRAVDADRDRDADRER